MSTLMYGDIRVPYVALWSSEMERFIGLDVNAGDQPATFTFGKRGEGVPVFGKMAEQRQRECVWRRRCQICRGELEAPYLAIDAERQRAQIRAIFRPLLTEPMICRDCALYSLIACPGIKRLRVAGDLKIYSIRRYERVACYLQPLQESDYPQLDKILREFGRTAVGFLKYAPTDYDEITEAQVANRG